MTIPTPSNFKGAKMVKEEVKVRPVEESRLGDGKLDTEDVKKVYIFASTNKQVIAAIVLALAAFVSGKSSDIVFQYLGLNTPTVEVQEDIDAVNARMNQIQAKLDKLIERPVVTPSVEPTPISMDFAPVPVDEGSNVPFTVNQDSTTDDGSSPIKTKTVFSVQSTEN